MHSPTHSLTYSLAHSLTHPFTHSPTHSHSLTHPPTHTHLLTHPLTLTHSLTLTHYHFQGIIAALYPQSRMLHLRLPKSLEASMRLSSRCSSLPRSTAYYCKVHVHEFICMSIYICRKLLFLFHTLIHTHTHTYIYIHTYTYTHTHTHIYTDSFPRKMPYGALLGVSVPRIMFRSAPPVAR